MAASKPSFVIVPGAWHPAVCFDDVAARIEAAGYAVVVATNASLASAEPRQASCAADAESLGHLYKPMLEEGKDIIVVAFSYGGIPAGASARGLCKSTRTAEGLKGGVIGLVYVAGFVVPEGISLVDFLGGKHAPYVTEHHV